MKPHTAEGLTLKLQNDDIQLSGLMTFGAIELGGGALIEAIKNWMRITKEKPLRFCLQAVRHIDSAGLSLLLECTRLLKKERRGVSFINAPEQLLSLTAFYGVSDFINLEKEYVVQ